MASPADREQIYRVRHDVYAREIGQHPLNDTGRLVDALDERNIYLVARLGDEVAGFVSLTPPGSDPCSIDKYFSRDQLPFTIDDGCFEVRLLTVCKQHRGTALAAILMFAAFRWVEAHGGTRIIAIGRREVLSVYLKAGLLDCGMVTRAGAVQYHLLQALVSELRERIDTGGWTVEMVEKRTRWQLAVSLRKPPACFHGGAFFDTIGPRFDDLSRAAEIINADVLDAWFPPAPAVVDALSEYLPWLLRTSPPTDCGGLVAAIAAARGVRPVNLLVGAGSSDLIFRALPRWLREGSRVLLLDPTYGEYSHILERVIGCQVDRLRLRRENGYSVPVAALETALMGSYDLVVLVNPNSPTGRHIPADELRTVLSKVAVTTRIWIDETYTDFVGAGESLETFAATSPNVIVCKSMSKAYALSGARVAYLCASAHLLEELRAFTPPWVVSLTGQVSAVRALESLPYYAVRWLETARLRQDLARALRDGLGWEVVPGRANFLLCHLPNGPLKAAELVQRCREHGLFLRDAHLMGAALGDGAVRIAVKDAATNGKIVSILHRVTASGG